MVRTVIKRMDFGSWMYELLAARWKTELKLFILLNWSGGTDKPIFWSD